MPASSSRLRRSAIVATVMLACASVASIPAGAQDDPAGEQTTTSTPTTSTSTTSTTSTTMPGEQESPTTTSTTVPDDIEIEDPISGDGPAGDGVDDPEKLAEQWEADLELPPEIEVDIPAPILEPPAVPVHPELIGLHRQHADAVKIVEAALGEVADARDNLDATERLVSEEESVVDDLAQRLESARRILSDAAMLVYVIGDVPNSVLEPNADGLSQNYMAVDTVERLLVTVETLEEDLDVAEGRLERLRTLTGEAYDDYDRAQSGLSAAEDEFEAITQQRLGALATLSGNHEVVTADAVVGPDLRVDAALAPAVEELMTQAREDGIPLGGWGHRTAHRTAELRILNGCPDIFVSPSSFCRVPTARPGESMHELGLAIDFTCDGATVTRGSACDRWLLENAHLYGLFNFPREAWHYSTNGR